MQTVNTTIQRYWQRYAKHFFLVSMAVFVFVVVQASVQMTAVAISTQPACVQQPQATEIEAAPLHAAKKSC